MLKKKQRLVFAIIFVLYVYVRLPLGHNRVAFRSLCNFPLQ